MKVHVSQGVVHYAADFEGPVQTVKESDLDAGDFFRQASTVHILGFPENAPLICRLYEARKQGFVPGKVFVGFGTRARPNTADAQPASVIRRMASIEYGASGNGWHTLSDADFTVYSLVQAARAGAHLWTALDGQVTTAKMLRLVKQHPAWPVLSFIGVPDFVSAVRLLATIVDPRWYYDPHSTRITPRLLEALGIGERAPVTRIKNVIEIPDQAVRIYKQHFETIDLTLRAWSGTSDPREQLLQILDSSKLEDPRSYLWRQVARVSKPRNYKRPYSGLLSASQLFIAALCTVWIANTAPHRELFVPEYFFQDADTAVAWRRHVASEKTGCEGVGS